MFDGVATEADGAAVGDGGRLAVNRLGDTEAGAVVAVKHALLAGGGGDAYAFGRTQYGQYAVVKGLGAVEVVGADHNMTEHDVFLILLFRQAFKVEECLSET